MRRWIYRQGWRISSDWSWIELAMCLVTWMTSGIGKGVGDSGNLRCGWALYLAGRARGGVWNPGSPQPWLSLSTLQGP